jgi:hypothetical protein
MEAEGSSECSQEFANCFAPDPDEFTPILPR